MKRYKTAIGFAQVLLIAVLGCGEDSTSVSSPRFSAVSDSSFTIGEAGAIEVGGFAGKVNVVSGDPGIVRVAVEKWAGQLEHLDQIEVELVEIPNGVRVTTTNSSQLNGVSVDLEIEVPQDTRPTLQLGAGEISYTGPAEGECQFGLGAGSITLRLPDDVNVEVHLSVGAGTISVDFPVVGQVSEHVVDGTIGTGADGNIAVGIGAGQIVVARQYGRQVNDRRRSSWVPVGNLIRASCAGQTSVRPQLNANRRTIHTTVTKPPISNTPNNARFNPCVLTANSAGL